MSYQLPCEFFLVRYVPNVVTGEYVNIGVLLRSDVPGKATLVEARFTDRWNRVLGLDPNADIELLKSLAYEISVRVTEESSTNATARGGESMFVLMRDSFSNLIHVSEPRTSMAETFQGEMDRLMLTYVDLIPHVGDSVAGNGDKLI